MIAAKITDTSGRVERFGISERFFAVESLGESVNCVGVIAAAVVVEEHIFLRFITLGFPPTMSSKEKSNTSYGVMVVEKIYAAVAIAVPTIIFNIGRQELRYSNCPLTGSINTEGFYLVSVHIIDQRFEFPVGSVSPFC